MKTIKGLTGMIVILIGLMSFIINDQVRDPWEIPDKYKNMENPFATEMDDLAEDGADIYEKHCTSCHGDTGEGDGSKADKLDTFPGDFTSDEFKEYNDGELYFMSIIGRDEMPNYEKKLPSEEDRWAVIAYIKTF
ncbi:MAG: cytochrome c [Bacteroidota bacterium]